jgi:hypothetical protein
MRSHRHDQADPMEGLWLALFASAFVWAFVLLLALS